MPAPRTRLIRRRSKKRTRRAIRRRFAVSSRRPSRSRDPRLVLRPSACRLRKQDLRSSPCRLRPRRRWSRRPPRAPWRLRRRSPALRARFHRRCRHLRRVPVRSRTSRRLRSAWVRPVAPRFPLPLRLRRVRVCPPLRLRRRPHRRLRIRRQGSPQRVACPRPRLRGRLRPPRFLRSVSPSRSPDRRARSLRRPRAKRR
jgi:hypothetical protein